MSTVIDSTAENPSVPYVSYPTFKNFIALLAREGIPARIDKSLMNSLAGGTQSHLSSALRFLGLVDSNCKPTDSLKQLAAAHDTSEWSHVLRPIVIEAYASVLGDLEIEAASPGQLDNCFRSLKLQGSSIDKAARFYIQCAKDADITVSSFIERRKSTVRSPKRLSKTTRPLLYNQPESKPVVQTQDSSSKELEYPVYFSNGRQGVIRVPADISAADCQMLELTIPLIKAYADRSK